MQGVGEDIEALAAGHIALSAGISLLLLLLPLLGVPRARRWWLVAWQPLRLDPMVLATVKRPPMERAVTMTTCSSQHPPFQEASMATNPYEKYYDLPDKERVTR